MTDLRKQQDKLWAKCPPGAIQKVAGSAKVTRSAKPALDLQRRKLLISAATAAGLVVIGGVAYLATRKPGQDGGSIPGAAVPMATYNFGGINCVEVAMLIPAYIGNTIDDPETTDQIKKHLELCDKCRMVYENQLNS